MVKKTWLKDETNEQFIIPRTLVEAVQDIHGNSLADILGNMRDGNPIGTIISFMGTSAPLNYLPCDGSLCNISDYPLLAEHFKNQFGSVNNFGGDGTTTFAVPDLRGEFLRGTGTNSHTDQGDGSDVGEHQNGTLIPMFYGYNYGVQIVNNNAGVSYYDKGIGTATHSISNSDSDWHGNSSGQASRFTSRPTNTSVLYCIKASYYEKLLSPELDPDWPGEVSPDGPAINPNG